MAFGGFGNNNNTSSAFGGGFGASNNTAGGFGANNNTSTGSSLFGGNTATSGGFGGFGASNSTQAANPFGAAAKPAFGAPAATSSSGLFGGGTSTAGGFGTNSGGFGNTANTSSGFGSNAGGGLFGNKPAAGGFGSSTAGTTSLFGGGASNTTNTGFGQSSNTTANNPFSSSTSNTNTGFGASNTGGGGFGGFGASNTAAANNNQGTAATPFVAIQEKDPGTTGMQAFQSITFQEPYKNKSFEELRTEDYAQGRKFGNANGQAGAFGQSTGFGGFGNNAAQTSSAGGMFGGNTATAGSSFGGFGNTQQANTATTGFGGNTGGGLFGQNKPATGGLFGNSAASAAPAASPFGGGTTGNTGGLFGNNNNTNTTGGFGGTNNANTGGGLFGNAPANAKPAFPGFGGSTNTTNAFGAGATNTTGGLFGNSNAAQPQQANPFGGAANNSTGGGLFGSSTQNKPAGGLFGAPAANTGGGLFGNNNNATPQNNPNPFGGSTNTGGLFGNNNQQQNNTGGGLFGNQNKPAGGGLFGNSTNTNAGGGLFGNSNNNQQQPAAGGGLFGNNNAGGGLFGNTQNKPATSNLFGSTNATNTGGGLFGNSQNNQNNGSSLFGGASQNQSGNSLFGGSNNQSQQPQQNQLHASLTGAPYGNEQLFASLATSNPPIGPLATPLQGAKPPQRKTPSLMQSMRLNSPVYTPRGGSIGRNGGYGFSYSTYGTPGSAFSGSLTPGASSMLRPAGSLGSGLSSRLNKSISMGNLRGDGTPGEGRPSLLRESAFSPPGSSSRYGNGSVRKLTIDRSLRTDLFGKQPEPEQPARRVRYDSTAETPDEIQPSKNNALVRTESQDTEQDDEQRSPQGLMKAPPQPAKQTNGPSRPEMSQVSGGNGALTNIPEDGVPQQRPGSAPATQQKSSAPSSGVRKDNEIGDYYTEPRLRDIKNMSRQQLQKIGKFVVGRQGVGWIEFGPCDLSTTQLDGICGGIVRLVPRSATVYQDDADKPAMGKALNVPSTIHLENSWPRSQGGRKAVSAKEGREYDKHIARLKRVGGTKFVNYDPETGIWTFSVEHFTTYGLDDEDDSEFTQTEQVDNSGVSNAPETPEERRDETMQSVETPTGEMDDTFDFKLTKRPVPGGFEEQIVEYDYDDPSADEAMDEDMPHENEEDTPHETEEELMRSPGGAVQAPSPGVMERYQSSLVEDEEMTGDVDIPAVEEEDDEEPEIMPGSFVPQESKMLRSILKPSRAYDDFTSPEKLVMDTWEEQLQRTMSPRKRDRAELRDLQQSLMRAKDADDAAESPFKQSMMGRSAMGKSALGQSYLVQKSAKKDGAVGRESAAFKTSMDIMKSLFQDDAKALGRKAGGAGRGFQYPYAKRARLSASDGLDPNDAALHDALKPSFAADGTIVLAAAGLLAPQLKEHKMPIVGEHKDVRFAKFATAEGLVNGTVDVMKQNTDLKGAEGVMPTAKLMVELPFQKLAQHVGSEAHAKEELAIWNLCSVLFDPVEVACVEFKDELPQEQWRSHTPRMRKDAFITLWTDLMTADVEAGVQRAQSAEEKAVLLLTNNDVLGACDVLVAAKNFRLASLVAQVPGSGKFREVMKKQIAAWQKRRDWTEMSDAVRALYSILAGEVCTVGGVAGAPEDRVEAFKISERFKLSWQQSLALRVLYGGHLSLQEAVKAFDADLHVGKETPSPASQHRDGDADTLMALLRLHAAPGKHDEEASAALCEPGTISGSANQSRVAWQLAVMLGSRYLTRLTDEKMAHLTLEFSTQLEAAGRIVEAVWALLYLRDSKERTRAVTGLLQRNAEKLEAITETLTTSLDIPASIIYTAQSILAKSHNNIYAQAELLLAAGQTAQAHEILISSVGPQAIIEQDYDSLAHLLSRFPRHKPAGWEKAGHAYELFLGLTRVRGGDKAKDLVKQLRRCLRSAAEEVEGSKLLEQRVAEIEMGRMAEEVAGELEQEEDRRRSSRDGKGGKVGMGAALLLKYRAGMGQIV
ncbi:hypothetical protein LTR62_003202 [Meristemomyces frigidus]|uniref:Peptidase S59 domain-containing protein n=1 Tax=Meristemomyces frigidus TaxID=1508187 RepID=A0AAN7YH88_9PEZI|nr:hypothetical protein LTR62_003202 [Meristemomyces frigidus]